MFKSNMNHIKSGMDLVSSVSKCKADLLTKLNETLASLELNEDTSKLYALDNEDLQVGVMRFNKGLSQVSVANQLGVSPTKVSRCEKRVIMKVKNYLSKEGYEL